MPFPSDLLLIGFVQSMSTCVILSVSYLTKLEGERDGSLFGDLCLFCTLIKLLYIILWS